MSEDTHTTVRPAPRADDRWSPRLWAILIVVCGALFLDGLDSAMIGVAIPSIQDEFAVAVGSVQWVISAYVLSFGGFLLFAGRLADVIGRRLVLIIGVSILLVASLLGTLAPTVELVIAARFFMGLGAALTAPAGLAIIATSFAEGAQRNRAVGVYTACGAVGFSAGLVGGGLLSSADWRWVFALSVAMAAIVFLGACVVVPRERSRRGPRRSLNLPGSLTLTAAMLLLVFVVVDAPRAGWASPRTFTLSAGVVVLLVAFVFIERYGSDPLFDRALLKGGDLVSAAIFSAAIMGTYTSFQFISALYLQQNLQWSPLQMAVGFLPLSVLVALVGPKVGRLIGAIGARAVIAVGFGIYTVAYLLFLRIGDNSSYWAVVLPTVVLIGFAFPLSFTGAYVQATSGVDDRNQGVASAVAQTGYQMGSAIVLAATTVIISRNGPDDALRSAADYRQGMYLVLAIAIAALVYALARTWRGKPTPSVVDHPPVEATQGATVNRISPRPMCANASGCTAADPPSRRDCINNGATPDVEDSRD